MKNFPIFGNIQMLKMLREEEIFHRGWENAYINVRHGGILRVDISGNFMHSITAMLSAKNYN